MLKAKTMQFFFVLFFFLANLQKNKRFRRCSHYWPVTVPEVFAKVNSTQFLLVSEVVLLQSYGHPHSQNPSNMGIPFSITLAIWVRVRVTEDAHITRVLGMGMPKTQGCPYHCDSEKKTLRSYF